MSVARKNLYPLLLTIRFTLPLPQTTAQIGDVPQRIWHITEASGQAAGEAWGDAGSQ